MQKSVFLGFGLITLLIVGCFYPSLFHIARADQLGYLAEVAHKKDFISLTFQSYDLNRQRYFLSGDQIIFCPVLFIILGTEKFFFHNNFIYWQAVGIIFHILTAGMLLKFLLNIKKSVFAYLLTAFFAVMPIPMEMVTWHHINSFLLSVLLMLIALDQIYSYIERSSPHSWRLWIINICLILAAFIYETVIIYTVLILIYFLMRAPKNSKTLSNIIILISPVFIFIICSAWNWIYLKNAGLFVGAAAGKAAPVSFLLLLKNYFLAHACCLLFGAFPSQFDFVLEGRTGISVCRTFQWWNIFSILLSLLVVITFIKGHKKMPLVKNWTISSLLFWMICFYIAIIAVGRLNAEGWQVLGINIYYSYPYWAFLIPFIYSRIDFDKIRKSPLHLFLKVATIVCLLALIIPDGLWVFNTNLHRAALTRSSRSLIVSVEQLKRDHAQDENFSFFIPDNFPGNYIVPVSKLGDPPGRTYSLIEVLYLDSFNRDTPKFAIR